MKQSLTIFFLLLVLVACGSEESAAPASEATQAATPAPVAAPEPAPAAVAESNESAEDAFKAAVAAANDALDKAKSVDSEWAHARWEKSKFTKCGDKKMSILAAAECFAANGDYDKAMELADYAKLQGDMGYEQGMAQKDAGPRF